MTDAEVLAWIRRTGYHPDECSLCVFCDKPLDGPWQEDLFHLACLDKAEKAVS